MSEIFEPRTSRQRSMSAAQPVVFYSGNLEPPPLGCACAELQEIAWQWLQRVEVTPCYYASSQWSRPNEPTVHSVGSDQARMQGHCVLTCVCSVAAIAMVTLN
jgi:hypothetical protein